MSSTEPAGKRGEPEYIENPQAPKRERKGGESPETRKREAKTEAVFKIQKQLREEEEEQATKPTRPSLGKRALSVEESKEPGKMRKGKKGEAVQAPQEGKASFKQIPRVVVQKMLGFVPAKKDLQSTRQVETFMNQEVVRHVKSFDLPRIRVLTEFLIDKHPELRNSLRLPKRLEALLESPNLDEYTEALYSARSRLIDILAQLEPEKIDQLEQDFNAKGMKFPTKFENFFQLVRIYKNNDPDELYALHETHECYRIYVKFNDPSVMTRVLEPVWRHLINPPEEEEAEENPPLIPDSATFTLIEQTFSHSNDPENKEVLFYAHLCQGWTRMANGLFDKGVESIAKAAECVEGREIEELYTAIIEGVTTSEIDPKGAEKLFTILEQSWKKVLDKDRQYKLAGIYGDKIRAYAQRGFAELQIVMNRTIRFLENIDDVESRHMAIASLIQLGNLDKVPEAEKEIVKTRIFHALQAAKNCPTKTELIKSISPK